MTIEDKIKCVLMDFEINEITLQEATKQILLLLNDSSSLPISSVPEFGSKEWVDCCEQLFGGKPKKNE